MNAVEQVPGPTPGDAAVSSVTTPSRVSVSELDGIIFAASFDDFEEMFGSIERVMVDSGAAVSVCPRCPTTRSVQR